MTFDPPRLGDSDRPAAEPPPVAPEPPIDGGGGTTLPESALDPPVGLRPVPDAFPEGTVGGGGTTSCVPKSLPRMLLTSEGLPADAARGGVTDCVGGGVPPPRRRVS